jgi:hypothetical protein
MTTFNDRLTIINVYNDSLQLGSSLGDALKSTNDEQAKEACHLCAKYFVP